MPHFALQKDGETLAPLCRRCRGGARENGWRIVKVAGPPPVLRATGGNPTCAMCGHGLSHR